MTTVIAWFVYSVIGLLAVAVASVTWREVRQGSLTRRALDDAQEATTLRWLGSLSVDPHTVPTPVRRGSDGRFLPRER